MKASCTATSCPITLSLRSYIRSISCWLVLSRARGMLMMERPVCCASALIRLGLGLGIGLGLGLGLELGLG